VGALLLDGRVFDEVEADPEGLLQAACVVLVAGLARGVFSLSGESGPAFVPSLAGAIVLWLLATGLLASVGVRWLHGTSDFHEMLRTLGFAAMPLWLLAPASFLPDPARLGGELLLHAWAIAAAVVAVRQALDVGTARALLACGLALAAAAGLLVLLGGQAGSPLLG